MKKIVLTVCVLLVLSGCSMHHYQGGAVGGVTGGVAGALIDKNNPYRGALIGAGIGALSGAALSEVISSQMRSRAIERPIEYRTEDGRVYYKSEPVSDIYYPNERTKCRKVREKVWENNNLVKDNIKEICEGSKEEPRY